MIARLGATVVALVALVSCSDDESSSRTTASAPERTEATESTDATDATDATDSATTVEPSSPSTATSDAPATTAASSVARQVLDEIVGWLNGEPVDEATFDQRFAPAFVQQVPFATFQQTTAQLAAFAPWTLEGEPEEAEPGALVAPLVDGTGQRATLELVLADPAQPVVESLLIQPGVEAPASPEAAIAELQALGTLRLATAEITGDGCAPITELAADELMPLASVFKLYVLGAVVDAVEAGTLTWDTPVVIRDELDSLPSGTTQDEPPGGQLPVRELATRMIAVSDNTATDHLIDLVGRDAVEAALTAYGHATPDATLPFPTTRELFVLKFSGGDLARRYAAAPLDERRSILAGEVAAAPLPDVLALVNTAPIAVEEVEWFASPLDVCRALARLARSDEARQILGADPGIPPPADRWAYVGFKGGSEPGVVAVAWLVEDDTGRRFVLAGGIANDDTTIRTDLAVTAFATLRDAIGS